MSMNIKNPSAEEAIRELAALTGESMTSAIEVAVRERLGRLHTQCATTEPRVSEAMSEDIRAMQEIFARNPLTRQQIDDELYDEWGLPR